MQATVYALALLAAQPLPLQDVAAIAATCATCHGPQGHGSGGSDGSGGIPALRGRSADYLLPRLRALKAARPNVSDASATIMPLLLQAYDDAQLAALARWFGSPEQP